MKLLNTRFSCFGAEVSRWSLPADPMSESSALHVLTASASVTWSMVCPALARGSWPEPNGAVIEDFLDESAQTADRNGENR